MGIQNLPASQAVNGTLFGARLGIGEAPNPLPNRLIIASMAKGNAKPGQNSEWRFVAEYLLLNDSPSRSSVLNKLAGRVRTISRRPELADVIRRSAAEAVAGFYRRTAPEQLALRARLWIIGANQRGKSTAINAGWGYFLIERIDPENASASVSSRVLEIVLYRG